MKFSVHDLDTAPDGARETLSNARQAYGFLPNLLAVMAEAPALLKAYRAAADLFDETSLDPSERQIVLLTTSYENECEYCVAAHTVIAGMQKVPEDVIRSVRQGRPIPHPRLEALRRFTTTVVRSRGWPSEAEVAAFLDAGYARSQVLEVILGVGVKTRSNYTTHIADTPLDQAFARAAWSKAA